MIGTLVVAKTGLKKGSEADRLLIKTKYIIEQGCIPHFAWKFLLGGFRAT